MRAAAVQLVTTLDKEANRDLAVRAAEEAAGAGASLVVLPEATMAAFGGQTTPLRPMAETLDGPFVTSLEKVAAGTGATVVAGMFEPADGERVFNTIVAVGPGGLVGAYRKIHLYDAFGWKESDRIAPGPASADALLVFEAGGLTIGVMNCYDLRFPEVARLLADRGADVIVEPANWIAGAGKRDAWTTLLRARAIENTAYVVAAAKPGPECAGCSMILDPAGEVCRALGADEVGTIAADLSRERIADVRRAVPVLANRRFTVKGAETSM